MSQANKLVVVWTNGDREVAIRMAKPNLDV